LLTLDDESAAQVVGRGVGWSVEQVCKASVTQGDGSSVNRTGLSKSGKVLVRRQWDSREGGGVHLGRT